LDPAAAPQLPVCDGPRGQVVALVVGAAAGAWAAEAALELAQGWSAAGVRLVLADAGLSSPSLDRALGEAPGEGLVDALRWGTSVRRVARRRVGRAFYVMTAGTAVADAHAVLEGPRWPALCAGFREAGVTLAVLVPGGDPCLQPVLRQASCAVVLAAPEDPLPSTLAGGAWPVLAILGREHPRPAPALAPEASPAAAPAAPVEPERGYTLRWPVEPEPAREVLAEPAPDVPPLPLLAPEAAPEAPPLSLLAPEPEPVAPPEAAPPFLEPEPESTPAFEPEPAPEVSAGTELPWLAPEPEASPEPGSPLLEPEPEPRPAFEPGPAANAWESPAWSPSEGELLGEPVPTFEEIVEEYEAASGASRARRRRLAAVAALVTLVAAAFIGAAWLGYLRVRGISPAGAPETPTSPSPPATMAAPPATENSTAAPYSLGLAAFQDELAARSMVQGLAGKVPGILFTIAPVQVDGSVLHRVLAGPVADSAAALALAARVAEAAALDPTRWVVRWTPRAFRLGEMPEVDAALRRSEVLQGLGVPSYVLAVTYSDGSVRFRVYAGAYADEAEASFLSGLLDERGLSGATLSDRTGRVPE